MQQSSSKYLDGLLSKMKNKMISGEGQLFCQNSLNFDMEIAEIKGFRKCAKIFFLSLQTKKFERVEILLYKQICFSF